MSTRRKTVQASKTFINLLRITLGLVLRLKYRYSGSGAGLLKSLKPPYLILPNHVNTFDPFLVGTLVPVPVHWVAGDATFRLPGLPYLMRLVGTIAKSKMMSDFDTIRKIMDIKKRKGVIGIFGEGQRTWDGHSLPIIFSTSKLVKLLKIPVVVVIQKGGFLTLPRWSPFRRRGRIVIEFKLGMTVEQIREASVETIQARLSELLDYDEMDYQKQARTVFLSRRRAEYLELVIFICPSCGGMGTLESRGRRFFCSCGFESRFNRFGFFRSVRKPRTDRPFFTTIRQWNLWQTNELRSRITAMKGVFTTPIFRDGPVLVRKGNRTRPLRDFCVGRILLFGDRIEIEKEDGPRHVLALAEVTGFNVSFRSRVEWYYRGELYRLNFHSPRVSGYKWLVAWEILTGDTHRKLDEGLPESSAV